MIDDYIIGFIVSGIVFAIVLYKYKTTKEDTVAQEGHGT